MPPPTQDLHSFPTRRSSDLKVPKDRDPASLTLEECQALIAAAPERGGRFGRRRKAEAPAAPAAHDAATKPKRARKKAAGDRKSTRLNSSHSQISYAVFCLKK